VSKTNEIDMAALDPSAGDGAMGSGTGGSGGGGGNGGGASSSKSKALRAEAKDADAPVFRLDSLAPGAAPDGAGHIPMPTGSRVSHAAIFFAVLIVVGGGLLFAMRKIGINPMSAIAKMNEPDVDLTKNGKPAIDHTRVLRDLSESTVKGQVPIEQVQKNPFEIPEVVAAQPSEDPEAIARVAAEKARKDAEGRKLRLESALANLKVHGILDGANPVARINDQAVRIGDVLDDLFTVKAIQGRAVELECDGQTFTISLDDETAKPSARKSAPKKK
jgi:hypothetical protein